MIENKVFDNTNLNRADFSSAINFTINPQNNGINRTKFCSENLIGLVAHLDIIID